MTTLHDLCYYESHRRQPLVHRHLIANKLDILPNVIIQSVLVYITPHPCSNQIKRFRRDRLRVSYRSAGTSFNVYLFWKHYHECRSVGWVHLDAMWSHHQHLDATDTLNSCEVCQRGYVYAYLTVRTESKVNSHIRPFLPIEGSLGQAITDALSNGYVSHVSSGGYISRRCDVLYLFATVDVKRELIKRGVYHPEGRAPMSILGELIRRTERWRERKREK